MGFIICIVVVRGRRGCYGDVVVVQRIFLSLNFYLFVSVNVSCLSLPLLLCSFDSS